MLRFAFLALLGFAAYKAYQIIKSENDNPPQ